MNILQINSSVRGNQSQSTRLANEVSQYLQQKHPSAKLTVRDLATDPIPMLDPQALQALFTDPAQRSAEQNKRVAIDDAAIVQVQAADVIVIGSSMYNMGISVQLKAWLDAITRARVTFRYTPSGPEGLLKGKKVYLALTRGGRYRDTPGDAQTLYLKAILNFLGMEVACVYAEGLALGDDPAVVAKSFAEAREDMAKVCV